MTKKHCVIFDLDGTLCQLSESVSPYNHTGEELPIEPIVEELLDEWAILPIDIFIVTGRKRKDHEKVTIEWLEKWDIPYDTLYMQEGSMAEKNHIFKHKVFKEIQKTHHIDMVYDDNPEVGTVCEDLGICFYPCY